MHLPHYKLKTDKTGLLFYFTSEGPKGKVRKLVQLSAISPNLIYNLSLCDYNPLTEDIDDTVVTNNNDTEKVLATVAQVIYAFFNAMPDVWVYVTGNTPARTRLYRMGINKYYVVIENDFEIFGETSDGWKNYQKGKEYSAFMVRKK